MLFNLKREANFLETFVSTLHHIPVLNNNVKYSTDYLMIIGPCIIVIVEE